MWPFRKSEGPTYAAPKPKQIVFSVEEVARMSALLSAMYVEGGSLPEDPELRLVVEKCLAARTLVRNGHRVMIFVSVGEMH